jgi:hypothetical protein
MGGLEVNDLFDAQKTATDPANEFFFAPGDIVLMDADSVHRARGVARIGVVIDVDSTVEGQVLVHYWDSSTGTWNAGPYDATSHYSRLTWIGNIDRFKLPLEYFR